MQMKAPNQQEIERQRAELRDRAQRIWDAAEPAPQHSYFEPGCWGIAVPGLRRYQGDMSIDGVEMRRAAHGADAR
jgi:hypothetical protein